MTRKDVIWIIIVCILIAVCLLGISAIDLSGPVIPPDTLPGSSTHGNTQRPDAEKETTTPTISDPLHPSTTEPTLPTAPSESTEPTLPSVPSEPTKPAEKTQITVNAVWGDENDQDGKRPVSVFVQLLADGNVFRSQQLTAETGWTFTFDDLDVYADGKQIVYTIQTETVENYATSVEGFTIVNTYQPEKTQVQVDAVWNDEQDRDGKRPGELTVHLLADGEVVSVQKLTEENGWKCTFEGLDKFSAGEQIVYTILAENVNAYKVSVDGFTVTGTYHPEKTQITVSVTWQDTNNQDGKRPASVKVHLMANNEVILTHDITAEAGWTHTFSELNKYADGEQISYTISADAVDEYLSFVDGFTVTNSRDPEKTEVMVNAVWDDENDRDGKRPDLLTVHLLANGEIVDTQILTTENNWSVTFKQLDMFSAGAQIVYAVMVDAIDDYTTSIDGFTVTNTYDPEKTQVAVNVIWQDANNQDGKRPGALTVHLLADGEKISTQLLTAEKGWTFVFDGLNKFAGGEQIRYTIQVECVEAYMTDVDGFTVTNTYYPEKTQVKVNAVWDDNQDQDGKRPASVTVYLLADGKKLSSYVLTAELGWTYTFEELDMYANGEQIVYTVLFDSVEHYTSAVNGYTVTNVCVPEKTQVTVNISWKDENDRDGKRPETLRVFLLANGNQFATKLLTAEQGWSFTFEELDVFAAGEQIAYTVIADAVEGYSTSIEGFTVKNTYEPEKTQISVSVVWQDHDDQDGKRPDSVTVQLYADGTNVQTATLTAANGWKFTFVNLDKFINGKKIVYTVTQATTAGYTVSIDGYTLTNTHEPEQTQVSVNISWQDQNNQDGKRPASVTVNLMANGAKVQTVTVTSSAGWKYTFAKLDKYANGKEIAYSITQTGVANYSTQISGYTITNSHVPEKTQIAINAIWENETDQGSKRPASVTVNLLANGVKVQTATLTSAGNWKYTFTKLDKYAGGQPIAYTLSVEAFQGYNSTVNGYTITNSYMPPEINEEILGPAYSIVLKPEASGVLVKSNDKALIDYSNTTDGYIMVKFTGVTSERLKVQVIGPTTTYTYNIMVGQWEVLPLSDGEGTYRIRILEHVMDNRYATVLSLSTAVTLKDAFAPFIRPNQYVNYENATQTVATSAELCRGKTDVLEKVKVIYDYVVHTLSYDYDKAATVESGYLPDLDLVLAEKKGICFDYAALMTAMLRCQGIPCKLVVGYAGTGYHAWISVWSEETGWIDGAVYFDGQNWQRMDPTFMSTSGGSQSVMDFIANSANYTTKYLY